MNDSRESCPDGWDPAELLAYLEGDLTPDDVRKLEEHFRTCAVCSVELGSLRNFDLLLKRHPASFHTEREELYRFATTGEDAQGEVEAHIHSCPQCKEELELLREMIALRGSSELSRIELPPALVHEFERSHGPKAEGRPVGGLRSWWRRLVEIPTSLPILTLGTAAAVVVIAILAVPLWKTYTDEASAPRSTVAPAAPEQKPAESSVQTQQAEPEKERALPGAVQEPRTNERLRKQEAGQAIESGDKRVEGKLERAKSGQPSTAAGRVMESSPSPEVQPRRETSFPAAAPALEPKRKSESGAFHPLSVPPGKQPESQEAHDKVARTREADRQNLEKRAYGTKRSHLAPPVDAANRIPVEVRIIDSRGRDLEEVPFVPPADEGHTFYRGTLEAEKKSPAKARSAASKDRKASDLVVIKVIGEGAEYHLEGQLFSRASVEAEKTIKIEKVGKEELARSIQDLVSSLIADR